MKLKATIFLLVLMLTLSFAVLANASITVGPNSIKLGYGNGTIVVLGAGTYDSIIRLDNVWYVNGEVYPVPTYITERNSMVARMWIAVGVLSILPVVLILLMLTVAVKKRELDPSKTVFFVVATIGIVIDVTLLIVIASALSSM